MNATRRGAAAWRGLPAECPTCGTYLRADGCPNCSGVPSDAKRMLSCGHVAQTASGTLAWCDECCRLMVVTNEWQKGKK